DPIRRGHERGRRCACAPARDGSHFAVCRAVQARTDRADVAAQPFGASGEGFAFGVRTPCLGFTSWLRKAFFNEPLRSSSRDRGAARPAARWQLGPTKTKRGHSLAGGALARYAQLEFSDRRPAPAAAGIRSACR